MRYEMPVSSLQAMLTNNESKNLKGAPFTVKSLKTGKDYTFKVKNTPYNGVNYVHVMVETEYMNFKYLGYFRNGDLVRKGGVVVDSPSALAAAWLLRQVSANKLQQLQESVKVYHIGNCCKCGKALTDAQSIEAGIGPKCRFGL